MREWGILVLLALASCGKVPQDPNDPSNPVWNPLDANAPPALRRTPRAVITTGPAQDGIVYRDSVTFAWKGKDTSVAAYRPCLDGECAPDFGPTTTTTYRNLEEGAHVFHVLARYSTGVETPPDSAEERRFTVDALGTSIRLSPRAISVGFEQDFALEVRASHFARVDTQRVKGLHLVLQLPAGMTAEVDTLGFFNRGTSRVFWWTDTRTSNVLLEMAVAGDPTTTPADSGAVARLRMRSGRTAFVDSVRIVECEVFNGNNHPLAVITRGAKVEVK